MASESKPPAATVTAENRQPPTVDRRKTPYVIDSAVTEKARTLRALHERRPLVLPNVWDCASAALAVRAGAEAVATTSGGVAWSLGRPDGEGLTSTDMIAAVLRIAATVAVPVTADVESGYGDVAATVRAVIEAGAAGVNIEDSRDGTLLPVGEQAERLATARKSAADAGLPELVLNARTDVHLLGTGDVLERATAYAEAGADCLFVPGLLDLTALRELVAVSPLPVNVMAAPNGPSITDLAATGVHRISVGTAIAQAAYGLTERSIRELLTAGTYRSLADAPGYAEIDSLFRER